MCSCQCVTNVIRSGSVFLPFFSSGCCLHQRNGLILLVWGFVLALAGQEGAKLCSGVVWAQSHGWAGLGSAECCPLPKAPVRTHLTFSRIETSAAHSPAGVGQHLPPSPAQNMNDPCSGCAGPSAPRTLAWLSEQPQGKVLHSTAPKHCCEKKQSQTKPIFSP